MDNVNLIKQKSQKSSVLDLYWKLADPEDKVREDSIVELLSHCIKQQGDSEIICSELDYAFNRLVGGLFSSRKAARLGYFVALVILLKKFNSIVKTNYVLSKIEQQTTNNEDENKVTKSDMMGYCLGMGSLIRSGLINTDHKLALDLVEDLLVQCQKEKCLGQLFASFIVELVTIVDSSLIPSILFKVKAHFEGGWKQYTVNTLWILLHFFKQLPKDSKKEFKLPNIYNENGLSRCVSIVMEAGNFLKPHPVFVEIVKVALEINKLDVFWNSIIESSFQNFKKERINFVFKLVQEIIPCLSAASQIKTILCSHVIEQLMRNLSNKTKVLYAASTDLINFLIKFVETGSGQKLSFSILNCLIEKPGSIFFDEITRTKSLYKLISHLDDSLSSESIMFLKKMFDEVDEDVDKVRFQILKLISYHIRLEVVGTSTDNLALQFLILLGYFNQISTSNAISMCDHLVTGLSDEIHKVAEDYLNQRFSALVKSINRNNRHHLDGFCHMIVQNLNFIVLLLEHPKIVSPLRIEITKKKLKSLISMLSGFQNKTNKDEEKSELALAFKLLTVHLAFCIVTNAQKTSVLEEIFVCYENAFSKKKKKTNDETMWPSVFVDVLLEILSDENALLCNVSYHAFDLFLPNLNVEALEHIINVIDLKQNDDIMNESNDDEDSVDESDAMSDDNIENGDHLDKLRVSVKDALGDAAADSDDAESEEYLDDEEMFKLDEKLSEAFRMMTKKNPELTNKDKTLQNFRSKCLDLLEVITKHQPKISLLLPITVALNNIIKNGMRQKGQNILSNRSMSAMKSILNIKKFKLESDIDVKLMPSTLQKIVEGGKVISLTADVCHLVLRCAMHCDKVSSQEKNSKYTDACMAVYKEWLTDFFQKNSYGPQIFSTVVRKSFVCGWQLVTILLKFSFNNDIRLFQRKHGATILKFLTSKQYFLFSLITEESWTFFSSKCFKKSKKILHKLLSEENEQNYCLEIINLLQNVVRIDKKYIKQISFPNSLQELLSQFKEDNNGHLANEIKKLLVLLPPTDGQNQ